MSRFAAPLTFWPMDRAAVLAIYTWHYEPPYDVYDLGEAPLDEVVSTFLDPRNAYHRILDREGELVAYCCFGPDAQVPGGDYAVPAVDIGLGLRPDLTGQGCGAALVESLSAFACHGGHAALRVTVAAFNRRAQRVWQQAGFEPVQAFARSEDGAPFVVLVRARATRPHLQEWRQHGHHKPPAYRRSD